MSCTVRYKLCGHEPRDSDEIIATCKGDYGSTTYSSRPCNANATHTTRRTYPRTYTYAVETREESRQLPDKHRLLQHCHAASSDARSILYRRHTVLVYSREKNKDEATRTYQLPGVAVVSIVRYPSIPTMSKKTPQEKNAREVCDT